VSNRITLHVVAVNYFGVKALPPLIESLRTQGLPSWRLTIVDNSVSSEQVALLHAAASADPRIDVIAAPANLGYLHAAEWWHTRADVNADWVAVANTDLFLADENFVEALTDLSGEAAIVAPDIIAMPVSRRQNPYMRFRPRRSRMVLRRLALSTQATANLALLAARRPSRRTATSEPGDAEEIYAPHGSFMLFHRSFFSAGGSLRHGPFLFAEELTIGERALSLGLRVRYEPSLRVIHNEHQTTANRKGALFRAQREAAVYGHRLISGRVRP
jgi:GT2 family glycosyltransferase